MFPSSTSRPPLRTYGRRGAGVQKRRAPSPEPSAGDSATDEDASGDDTPRVKQGNARSTSSTDAVKRSRTEAVIVEVTATTSVGKPSHEPTAQAASSSSRRSLQRSVSHNTNSGIERPAPTTPKRGLGRTQSHNGTMPSPRDLSDLFLAVSPGPSTVGAVTPPRPKGPRRMLSKAQSMNASHPVSASEPTTPRSLRTAQSMPITPTSARSIRSIPGDASGSNPGSPIPTSMVQAAGPASPSPSHYKRTYGGSRSFLSRDREADTEAEVVKESYEEQRKRYEVDAGDADPLGARAPEPIADMRSKGENRRFMGEIGFLLEGMQGPASGARRSSALELLNNMLNAEWLTKLHVSGQTEPTFELLLAAAVNDDVMQAIALLYPGILAVSGSGLDLVLHGQAESVVRLLASNLGLRDGPLDADYKGKTTPIIQALRRTCSRLVGSSSTQRLASLAMSSCLTPRLLPLITHPLLEERVGMAVLSALVSEGGPLVARTDLYSKGLDLISKDDTTDFTHIQQCLEIMTVLFADAESDREDESRYFDDLMGLFVILMAAAEDEDLGAEQQGEVVSGAHLTPALRCAILSLQPLVALASAARRASWLPYSAAMLGRLIISRDGIVKALRAMPTRPSPASPFAGESPSPSPPSSPTPAEPSPPAGGKYQAPDLAVDDIMSFALAILLSMIDSPDSATTIATTLVSGCSNRACIRTCRCPSAQPLASTLATLYSDDTAARGDNDLTQIYLHGYLAYIIARLLVTARGTVQPLVEPLLPGSGWGDKLEGVREALVELRRTNAHTTATGGGGGGGGGGQGEGVVASGESTDALLEEAIVQLGGLRNE